MRNIAILVSLWLGLANAASSSSSSRPKVTTPPGCPPVTYTTSTTITTEFARTEPDVTQTISTTSTTTRTVTGPPVRVTDTTYLSTRTVTTTVGTVTSTTYGPVSTTVTVAAPRRFTSVLCEEVYYDRTKTVTTTFTLNGPYTAVLFVPDTAPVVTSTVTELDFDRVTSTISKTTVTSYVTRTKTTTVRRPTRTRNLACSSPSNLTSKDPYGGKIGYAVGNIDGGTAQTVYASDPTDCCEQCFASNCTGSTFYTDSRLTPCDLFYAPNTTSCDQATTFGQVAARSQNGQSVAVIANGPCGQYAFWTF